MSIKDALYLSLMFALLAVALYVLIQAREWILLGATIVGAIALNELINVVDRRHTEEAADRQNQ